MDENLIVKVTVQKEDEIETKVIQDTVVKLEATDLKYVKQNLLDANATPEDVLVGKTFYSRNSEDKQEGTMNPGDYAPIQSISKNGTYIEPDEYKNVNIVITKSDVGLDKVDNTPDIEKPVSKEQQKALDDKVDKELKTNSDTEYKVLSDNNYTDTEKKNLSELVSMKENDEFGKVDDIQVNDTSIVSNKIAKIQLITGFEDESEDKFSSVKNTTILNKKISLLDTNKVDKVEGKGLSTNDYTNEDKNKLSGIENGAQVNTVISVAGKIGDVVLNKTDVGLENVDNTSDINKPISTAQQEEFNKKADTEKVVLLNKEGTQNITSNIAILGDLNISGNIIQQGSAYETHAESVYTKNDYIITRDGAVGGLGNGEYTGIVAKLYDGTNDGRLVFDNKGIARVGDAGDEQPLATREETPIDKSLVLWDNETNKLITNANIKYSENKLLYNNSEVVNLADEQTITGKKNYKNISTFNNAIYLTNISDSVKTSVSRLYFGSVDNPYAYISANTNGAFGILNNAGNGIVCYPETTLFALGANLDLGRTNNKWKDLYLSGKITDGTNSYSVSDLNTQFNSKVSKVEGKDLSTNDFTDDYKSQVESNTTARHTHNNKTLLDTYTQTETNLADAVAKKHTHDNKEILDGTTASYTTDNALSVDFAESERQKSKNLFNATISEVTRYSMTYSADTSKLYISGDYTDGARCQFATRSLKAGTYTLCIGYVSGTISRFSAIKFFLYKGTSWTQYAGCPDMSSSKTKVSVTFTLDEDVDDATLMLYQNVTNTMTDCVFQYQIVEGSNADFDFQPYNGAIVRTGTNNVFTGLNEFKDQGLLVSGRVQNSGDDEGIVVTKANNGYAGLCLGNPVGLRSVLYLKNDNNAIWRYCSGDSNTYDIVHPKKAGTIALTSDIPDVSSYVTKDSSNIINNVAGMYGRLFGDDTRSINGAPSTYQSQALTMSMRIEFKDSSAINSPISNDKGFVILQTINPWGDTSGGLPSQLSYGSKLSYRTASSSSDWNSWRTLIDSGDIYQTTGTSTTGAMSQKATTDELNNLKLQLKNNISSIKTKFSDFKKVVWNGSMTHFYGKYIWSDGDNIYYNFSPNSPHYILNKQTMSWETMTWNGLTSFNTQYIWSDGNNVYYSYSDAQYVLDTLTNTWNVKTWNGNKPLGSMIWSDGTNIYCSSGTYQLVLNKETDTWETKTWKGLTSIDGDNIWSDGNKIYYSYGTTQYVLKRATNTWETMTWNEVLPSFYGRDIWTDGTNIYHCSTTAGARCVLDIPTNNWIQRYFSIPSFNPANLWSDGTNIYFSDGDSQYILYRDIVSLKAKF